MQVYHSSDAPVVPSVELEDASTMLEEAPSVELEDVPSGSLEEVPSVKLEDIAPGEGTVGMPMEAWQLRVTRMPKRSAMSIASFFEWVITYSV
jgi:hypothetical protein